MKIEYYQIGKRIARRRKLLGMTQQDLAEKAALSTTFTGNIERGAKCSIESLMKMCVALAVTPDYILLGIDKEYRSESLADIKDALFRCDPKKKKVIKEFIQWFTDQNI